MHLQTTTAFLILLLSSFLTASNLYPEWFIYQEKYPGVIVGYTYNGRSTVTDAENMYSAFHECIAWGTLEIYNETTSNNLLKNSEYYYYFSPDSVKKIQGRLKKMDAFEVSVFSNDSIAAFYPDSVPNIQIPRFEPGQIEKPLWLSKTFFQDTRYYYGVGMYTALGRENDGWKTAEEQGIFAILNGIAIEIHKINITSGRYPSQDQDEGMEQISFFKVRYLLHNIQILERYPDRENKLYYVLVRIPRNGVSSPFIK